MVSDVRVLLGTQEASLVLLDEEALRLKDNLDTLAVRREPLSDAVTALAEFLRCLIDIVQSDLDELPGAVVDALAAAKAVLCSEELAPYSMPDAGSGVGWGTGVDTGVDSGVDTGAGCSSLAATSTPSMSESLSTKVCTTLLPASLPFFAISSPLVTSNHTCRPGLPALRPLSIPYDTLTPVIPPQLLSSTARDMSSTGVVVLAFVPHAGLA
jgi:hypothetical protein